MNPFKKLVIKNILIKAKAVIANPDNWIQNSMAQGIDGWQTSVSDPQACKFCSVGAIYKVNGSMNSVTELARIALEKNTGGLSLDMFNDTHTHQEVMALFDTAIKNA